MLDDLGLVPTLRWFINKISKRANMEVKFETMRMDERLDPNIETVLYRISHRRGGRTACYLQLTFPRKNYSRP